MVWTWTEFAEMVHTCLFIHTLCCHHYASPWICLSLGRKHSCFCARHFSIMPKMLYLGLISPPNVQVLSKFSWVWISFHPILDIWRIKVIVVPCREWPILARFSCSFFNVVLSVLAKSLKKIFCPFVSFGRDILFLVISPWCPIFFLIDVFHGFSTNILQFPLPHSSWYISCTASFLRLWL